LLLVLALIVAGGAGLVGQLAGPDSTLAAAHPGQTMLQDSSSALHWSAGWRTVQTASASGGTEHATGRAGASVSLTYVGTKVQIVGPTRRVGGSIQVTLDGTTTSVSTHAKTFHARQVLFTATPVSGHHVLTIRFAGTASRRYVAIDDLLITPLNAVAPALAPPPKPNGAPTSPPRQGSGSGTAYGMGIGADSLANTQVGGSDCNCANNSTSYRFLASTSSQLDSVRIYLMSGSGYSGGNGGTLSISVQTDDGSALHAPSGTVLASTTITPGNPVSIGYLPLVTFSSPATLVAGRLYHIVFRNTAASPTANYVSVNALWTSAVTTPRQQAYSDVDWAQLMNDGSGWAVRQNYTPILDLAYANGVQAGMGYMEVWVNAPETISGSSAVRENFTPTADHSVSSVSVRVRQLSGSSPLTIRLETAGGTVLATGSIAAASIGSSPTWVTTDLSSDVNLNAGQGYLLVLSAPSDSAYSAFAIERGNNYQFAPTTYFRDGYGQYTTGSGWSGFNQPGGSSNNTNSDLQFLFR
jgi:hypothetical protein